MPLNILAFTMMRTYTRKRPHHELIEDVQKLCRLCLNKVVEAIPIFTEDPNNIYATLALRIMICVGLEVSNIVINLGYILSLMNLWRCNNRHTEQLIRLTLSGHCCFVDGLPSLFTKISLCLGKQLSH